MNIKKDDTVIVISGKYKGKKGKVLRVDPQLGRLVVEGVNIRKKHQRPTKDLPRGGIIEKEGPINRASVMLVCPSCSRPTRVKAQFKEDGTKVRACVKCGQAIDK